MLWTEEDLRQLPESDGFRLRGAAMTRLETFVAAAFAFAMTMVVISISEIPGNYQELLKALKGVPAFAASFSLIMLFWFGHRNWSRWYGLDDGRSIILSLALIFIMLVYVYPLKLLFSSFFSWITGGWLPSQFAVSSGKELIGLFVVYGVGFGAMAGVMALLYRRARSAAEALNLDALERVKTAEQIASWTVQSLTGLASAAFAWLMPAGLGIWAGFIYCTLPATMFWIGARYHKQAEQVRAA